MYEITYIDHNNEIITYIRSFESSSGIRHMILTNTKKYGWKYISVIKIYSCPLQDDKEIIHIVSNPSINLCDPKVWK